MKFLPRVALVAALSSYSLHAAAQGAEPTAEQIRLAAEEFDQGKASFKAGDYVEAAERFEKADSNAPSATAIDLAMRSRERANQLDRAATLAALAIERHPDKQQLQEYAATLLERADSELYKLSVTCDTPCDLVVDSKIVHGAPSTARIVYLQPGNFTLKAGWSGGRTRSEKITAGAGETGEAGFSEPSGASMDSAPQADKSDTSEVEAALAAEAMNPNDETGIGDEQPKSGGLPKTVFWVGAGLTVVAAGITAWSGIDTVNNPGADTVEKECVGLGESCPAYQEGLDKQTRTNVLLGVTAGLGVITVLVGAFATDWGSGKNESVSARAKPRPKSSGLSAAPWIDVGRGAMVGASGRF